MIPKSGEQIKKCITNYFKNIWDRKQERRCVIGLVCGTVYTVLKGKMNQNIDAVFLHVIKSFIVISLQR